MIVDLTSSRALLEAQQRFADNPDLINKALPDLRSAQRMYEQEALAVKENCKNYWTFFRCAWDVLEPGVPLEWNWHIKYLCDELEAAVMRLARGEPALYHILINIPPRSLKSTIVTKILNAWVWTFAPHIKFISSSYSEDLAVTDGSVKTRRIIQSEWYQRNWGGIFKLTSDSNVKSYYENDKGGHRVAITVNGQGTGHGADIIIVDDPQSQKESESETMRKSVITWWTQTLPSRLNNQKTGLFVVIQQRFHENDLTGYILNYQSKRFKHICIPSEDMGDNVFPLDLRRRYIGGLFFPRKFGDFELAKLKSAENMGEWGYAGQYLQKPSPPEGGSFKRWWWKYWKPIDFAQPLPGIEVKKGPDQVITIPVTPLPEQFDDVLISWDFTFKDLKTSDYVVGQVWGSKGADKYLLDQIRAKMDFPACVKAVIAMRQQWPRASGILVEDKANGSAIIAELKRLVPGIIPVQARESKYARAMPMSRQAEAGNIYLPHPSFANWISAFVDRFAAFPNVKYDDEVDAASQCIDKLSSLKRIWPIYSGNTSKIAIDFNNLGPGKHFICSQWVDKDLSTSILLMIQDSTDGRLAIFHEAQYPMPRPEIILQDLNRYMRNISNGLVGNLLKFEWLGNEKMFHKIESEGGGDLKEAFDRAGVNPLENESYDEFGSIILVAQQLVRKKLFIDESCVELARQMCSWCLEDAGKRPQNGYFLCRALLNVICTLYTEGRLVPNQPKPLEPYTKAYTRTLDNLNSISSDSAAIVAWESGQRRTGAKPGNWII